MPTMKQGTTEARRELAMFIREGRTAAMTLTAETKAHLPDYAPTWAERVEEVVAHVLRNLGDTPDEIAGFLGRLGVNGERGDCDECPVARLVYRHFPGLAVEADEDELKIDDGEGPVGIMMPVSVERFIEAFDAGGYEELEDVATAPDDGEDEEDEDA